MSKKNKANDKKMNSPKPLSFGKYSDAFELLRNGETSVLKDDKSEKKANIPVKATEDNVYVTEPDGKLIPSTPNQRKCDFLIYSQKSLQTCFFEFKGKNINKKEDDNPYQQIIDTIDFLQKENDLNDLVNRKVEKHAFIVSPGNQKIPKGVDTLERILCQKIIKTEGKKAGISERIHYVKVTPSDKYSNKKNRIICSSRSPMPIPFKN
ncbi:MAG: hypothetical protein ACI4HI_18365 [Lachnospiraceae bacterium]